MTTIRNGKQRRFIEGVAEICHEANRAYCDAIGDDEQAPWAAAPKWQRDSAIAGVQFHMDNPDSTPEDSHKSWLAEKEKDGWTYGPEKDPVKKTHPCFTAYVNLPMEQRAKDYIFSAIVKTAHKQTS